MREHLTVSSFRDPAGSLVRTEDRIFRFILDEGMEDFTFTQASSAMKKMIAEDKVVSYRTMTDQDILQHAEQYPDFAKQLNALKPRVILEHKRISFPSYPYEWSPKMLFAAGILTVQMSKQLLQDGIGLKDATPYNVLFVGPRPVFVDLLSFEKREPTDPVWLAYAQFVRTFLLPLYMHKSIKLPLNQIFFTRHDGLEIEECLKALRPFSSISYSLILLPFLLSKVAPKTLYNRQNKNPDLSSLILRSLMKRTAKQLHALRPKAGISFWSKYMQNKTHYSDEAFLAKEKLLTLFLEEKRPAKVLDVGCNTGYFSMMAAKCGAEVVAIDYDAEVIDRLWQHALERRLHILPLVVDIARPTPQIGWKNQEYTSFLARAHLHFDMVLMLAVIHHLLVTNRVPIEEIASLSAGLTRDVLVIEYIDPKDPMFMQLVRGRSHLFAAFNMEAFRAAFMRYFTIERTEKINETRALFLMRKI